jgi:hypothetical protein
MSDIGDRRQGAARDGRGWAEIAGPAAARRILVQFDDGCMFWVMLSDELLKEIDGEEE